MRESAIPIKTAAGRQEVDERKHKLGPRHRMVLISINGERSVADIRQQFAAINEIDSVLDDLAAGGMIELAESGDIVSASEVVTSPPGEPAHPTPPRATPVVSPTPTPAPAPTPKRAPVHSESLDPAREFMTRMLTAKAGLRAFLINQKIEKAATREALIELLPEFRRLLRKNVDAGRVAEFSAHAEELIGQD
jgi:hypothetical protein